MSDRIHPTAIIDKSAHLEEGVEIGPYTLVGPKVHIKKGTWIQSNVRVDSNTTIGEGCRIYHGASVGNDPQDKKYEGEEAVLEIGDRTVVREFATLHRGTSATGKTVVGSDCLLMNYTHVAHDCVVGEHVILSNGVQLGGHVEIGEWAIIGGLTGVHQFARVGAHCMVGFGYRVTQDVPPFLMVAGEPMRPMGINRKGLERRGFSEEAMDGLKSAFRILYRSNLSLSEAVTRIELELNGCKEVGTMVDFVRQSERGLVR